nr:3-phosphoshikimate 1-carboxyvinyltransferase 2 [Tanacetum cinerariifolium]
MGDNRQWEAAAAADSGGGGWPWREVVVMVVLERGVASWRMKETERMIAICTELRKLGATVEEGPDYCIITPPEELNVTELTHMMITEWLWLSHLLHVQTFLSPSRIQESNGKDSKWWGMKMKD